MDRAGIFINDIYMSCGGGGWVGRTRMMLGRGKWGRGGEGEVVLADNDTVGM